MPIAFPPINRCPPWCDVALLYRKSFAVVPAPRMDRMGGRVAINLRRLGIPYSDPTKTAVVNRANAPVTDDRVFDRALGVSQIRLAGVSRDNAGAPLGNCTVKAFRTSDDVQVGYTTSDANGNWTIFVATGSYYLVEYKAGAPDVFGTSLNTLAPLQG